MAISIRKRLDALEGAAHGTPDEGERDEQRTEIAKYERMACLMVAHHQHHKRMVPIDSLLPDVLRFVDENEARRLLALDYKSFYSAAGMPNSNGASNGAKPPSLDKPEERTRPKTQVPGGSRHGR